MIMAITSPMLERTSGSALALLGISEHEAHKDNSAAAILPGVLAQGIGNKYLWVRNSDVKRIAYASTTANDDQQDANDGVWAEPSVCWQTQRHRTGSYQLHAVEAIKGELRRT